MIDRVEGLGLSTNLKRVSFCLGTENLENFLSKLSVDLIYKKPGAEGGTRTPTGSPPLDPEPSVSTNSTTSAF